MTRADLVVVSLALLMLPFLYVQLWGERGPGTVAEIAVGNGPPRQVLLASDGEITVQGALGTSILEVKGGAIRFVDSPCSAKACIHSGWLSGGGEVAACLPNRVSVRVRGADTRFDAINF